MEFGGSSGNDEGDGSNSTNNEVYTVARRFHNHNFVPLANVTKTMRKVLPPYAKVSDESKVTVQECVTQFIKFITSEANDHTHSQLRKTIGADDLLLAMTKLGFSDYVGPLSLYLKRLRQSENPNSTMQGALPNQELAHGMVPNDSENFRFPSPSINASQLSPLDAAQMFGEGGFYSLPPQSTLPPLPPSYHANDVSFSSGNIVHNWTSTSTPPNVQDPNIISSASPHYGYFIDPKSGGC